MWRPVFPFSVTSLIHFETFHESTFCGPQDNPGRRPDFSVCVDLDSIAPLPNTHVKRHLSHILTSLSTLCTSFMGPLRLYIHLLLLPSPELLSEDGSNMHSSRHDLLGPVFISVTELPRDGSIAQVAHPLLT